MRKPSAAALALLRRCDCVSPCVRSSPCTAPTRNAVKSFARRGVSGIQPQCDPKLLHRLRGAAFAVEHRTEIEVNVGLIGIDVDRRSELLDGIVDPALGRERGAELVAGREI